MQLSRKSRCWRLVVAACMSLCWATNAAAVKAPTGAGRPAPSSPAPVNVLFTNGPQQFSVSGYSVKGDSLLTNAPFVTVLERFTGTTVTLAGLVDAASALEREYRAGGYTNVNITFGREEITNGIVRFHVFRGAKPQIVVDGRPCSPGRSPANSSAIAVNSAQGSREAPPTASTNAASSAAAPAKASPGFVVRAYEIHGDTLLSEKTLIDVLEKYTGTNVTVADISKAGTELQKEYFDRGYVTVKVTVPPQKLDSNALVKIKVIQGRLSEINVLNNHHFSSNNVMRALPSLHTNMILVNSVFQAELDRANANQDRQIYPEIRPGESEGTTALDLKVKDRLPLHAKVDFNNQNSPGTPELRLNTSAVYNNLWQLEHSAGVQYGFSPMDYKSGDQWDFYDLPLVANYGAFYRMPLGTPGSLAQRLASSPGTFGYNEATRKFNLPPPSGQAELNLFASRSSIDTGVMTLFDGNLYNEAGNSLDRRDVQQDLTITTDLGTRLTTPLPRTEKFQSGFSAGIDYKTYELTSSKTNIFTLTSEILDTISNPGHVTTNINVSMVYSPVPTTFRSLDYLPLSLRYNASLKDELGVTAFGVGLSYNAWDNGPVSNIRNITGSAHSLENWFILNPSLSREFIFHTNWVLSIVSSGQFTGEPVISNEQFGIGGIGSVRGYHEGEVFGNSGWTLTLEQKTPPVVVGRVYGRNALSVRGSVYMGYGQAFAQYGTQDLWGVGFGGAASVGPNFDVRLLFSWPLISTAFTRSGQPRFDFGLGMQF